MGGGHMSGGFNGGARGGVNSYHGGNWGGGYHGWNGNNWHGNNWHGNGWHGNRYYRPWGWGYPYWGWNWGWGAGWSWYPGWSWGWGGDSWDTDNGSNASYSYAPDMSTYAAAPGYAPSYPSVVYMTPEGTLQDAPPSQTQEQIDQLKNQVAQLQADQQRTGPKVTDVHYDTVLVYRDGHTETIGNYAIVGKTLWVFNETHARKIPLAELNLPATERNNQERGNDFVVPGPSR